eukprot:g34667.t1
MTGELGPAECSSCKMWEISDTSSLHGDHICRKCVQLQLLIFRMERLELQTDSLRSIHVDENAVDGMFSELAKPPVRATQAEKSWEATRKWVNVGKQRMDPLVKDVSEQAQDFLKGDSEQPEVMVHIGTNDIDRKRDEVLQRDFRKL